MRLHLLHLRTPLGWGKHPNELRANRDVVWRALPLLLLVLVVACVIIPAALLAGNTSHHRPTSVSQAVSESAPFLFLCTAVELLVIVRAIWWGILARHGDRTGLASVYGRCFEVLSRPPGYLFARIGLTPETACWYAMPLAWDKVVEPGDAEYELTENLGTGWVQRVRRGASPREVVQESSIILTREAARAKAEEDMREIRLQLHGDATKEEWQAFKRFARAQHLEWHVDGEMFAAVGWTFLLIGALAGAGWSAFVLFIIVGFPQAFHRPIDYEAPVNSVIVVIAIGAGILTFGLYCFTHLATVAIFPR